MTPFIAELTGTALLITFGGGVVANVLLHKSKGQNAGWIVIALGWAMAVFIGVYASAPISGAHLNPAVTFALAIKGDFAWADVPSYVLAQFLGAFIGSSLVWLSYKQHLDAHPDSGDKLAVFSNAPAIPNTAWNFITETIATFVFILSVLFISKADMKLGALDALPVSLIVLAIGLSMGGPTGYAINPARDLGPRIMHALLPIQGKGNSNWRYAWIPVLGPLTGAALAVFVFQLIG